MGSTITKSWEITADDHTKGIVQLRHHTITGARTLLIDGNETFSDYKLFDDGDIISFDFKDKKGVVRISLEGLATYSYKLIYNGKEYPDMNSSKKEYKNQDVKISIPSYEIREISKEEKTVVYVIKISWDGQEHNISKRYSEIAELDSQVRSAYADGHLLSSMPQLPPRQLKLLQDHLSPEFIEQRRHDLEVYLQRLVSLPKVTRNPDLLRFIGVPMPQSAVDSKAND